MSIEFAQAQSPDDIRLNYSALNKTLPVVLKDLTLFSGVNIVFSETKIKPYRKVTINAKNERLGDILKVVLSPFKLDYEIVGNNIVIIDKRSATYGEMYKVQGYIRDKNSGEALPYASLYSLDNSWGINANENGYFSVEIKRGQRNICASYIGYKTDTLNEYFSEGKKTDILLQPNNMINEIIVIEDKNDLSLEALSKYYSKQNLTNGNFFGGEADIIHKMNSSSGITSGADGFGGINVRGGSNDQNLVLMDGVPIQHIGHAFGVLSIFNSNAIQDARLYKSNFPSRFGGKLSSVLDIHTREGNHKKLAGEFSLSTLAASGTIEGPIIKDRGSFILSFRRTYADPWIKAISKFQNDSNQGYEGQTSYHFYDINGRVGFAVNPKNKVNIGFYKGQDNLASYRNFESIIANPIIYSNQSKSDWQWGNTMISLSLNSQIGSKGFSRLLIYNTDWAFDEYSFERFAKDSIDKVSDIFNAYLKKSSINSKAVQWDADFQLNNNNRLRFGAAYINQKYSPAYGSISNIDTMNIFPNQISSLQLENKINKNIYSPNEIKLHIEDAISFKGGFSILAGIHASRYSYDTTHLIDIQPRISFIQSGDYLRFQAGISKMRQYEQVLSETGLGFPSDLWITSTNYIKPANAWIYSVGLSTSQSKNLTFSIEAYYKQMSNLIALNEGSNIPFAVGPSWDLYIPRGKAKSYGVDVEFSKITGSTNFEFNYSLSLANQSFADLNNGNDFSFRYHRKHSFNLLVKQVLGENAEFVTNFAYYTGSPVSYPSGEIAEYTDNQGNPVISVVFSEKNGDRLPDYQRVDVGFNLYSKYKWGRQKIFLGVYNVLNKKNPLYLKIDKNNLNPEYYEIKKVSVVPIFPTVSYSISF